MCYLGSPIVCILSYLLYHFCTLLIDTQLFFFIISPLHQLIKSFRHDAPLSLLQTKCWCFPQIHTLNNNFLLVMALGGGGTLWVIGSWGQSPQERNQCLYERDPREFYGPFCHVRHSKKMTLCEPRSQLLPDTKLAGALIFQRTSQPPKL